MDWTLVYIIACILILPAFIFGSICQANAHSTFEKYADTHASGEITGAELTELLLEKADIKDVEVARINGKLTDCYDPKNKVIKLSDSTYNSTSISALGVCAHEVGHAIQDHKKSFLFRLRSFLVPVVNFISGVFIPLILIGSILNFTLWIPAVGYYMVWASVISYGASLIFQFVTLPLEYDASKKALKMLEETEILDSSELKKTHQVLKAAISTYVSNILITLLYFIRFLSYLLMFLHKD